MGESGVGEGGMGEWILYVAKEGEVLAGAEAEVAMVERSWNWDRERVLLLNGRRRESCLRTGRGNVSKMVGGMGLLGWRRIDCHEPVLGDMMGQFTSNTGGRLISEAGRLGTKKSLNHTTAVGVHITLNSDTMTKTVFRFPEFKDPPNEINRNEATGWNQCRQPSSSARLRLVDTNNHDWERSE